MFRTAVRNLRAHRLRFTLPGIAVLLGVAFVSGSLMYTDSIQAGQAQARSDSLPDVSVTVRAAEQQTGPGKPGDEATVQLDDHLVNRLRQLPGATGVRGTVEGPAFLVGRNGDLVGEPQQSSGVNWVPDNGGKDSRYRLINGRGPRTSDEIAVDERSAEQAGYRVGDRVRVVVTGTARNARLTGTFSGHDSRLDLGGTLTAFRTATASQCFTSPGNYSQITLTSSPGTSQLRLAEQAEQLLPPGAEAVTRARLDAETILEDPKLRDILLSFAAVALGVSVFLVANTFTMLSAARAREHALLRAVGATRRQVLRLILTEAGLVGAVASAAGYALGIGVAYALNSLFGFTEGPTAPLRVLATAPLLAAFGVGLAVTTVSAYLPARRAAAVPPVAALRSGAPPTTASLRRRNIAGLVTTGLGALLTWAATADADIDLLYLAVPVLLTGLITLTPLISLGFTRLLRSPLTRFAGVRGTLAVENTRRNPRRTAATATALMIGLSLVTAVTVGASSASGESEREAREGMASDLRVKAVDFAEIGDGTSRRIAELPDAEAVTPVVPTTLTLTASSSVQAIAVATDTVARLDQLHVRSGTLKHLDRGIAVTTHEAAEQDWHLGSRVRVTIDGGSHRSTLPVVAVYDGPQALAPALISTGALPVPSSAEDRPHIDSVVVQAAAGRTAALRDAIRRTLNNPALLVQDRAAAEAEAVRPIKPFLNIMYALLSVTVLIGALGVINTMGMAVSERVREIGLLRAVGLDRKGIGSVFRLESTVIALLGSLLGLSTGCVMGAAAVAAQGDLTLDLPWTRLALLFAASCSIGVLASILPARRAAAVPTIEALRSDTE
ncbi:MAG TPA: FtsX-like permease family protein [Streptomyces sp.]|nr:FtsX-like permease family protein [Streptomyces sp.]